MAFELFPVLTVGKKAAVDIHMNVHAHMSLECLGVKLLVHGISVCLALINTTKQFFKVFVQIYTPTSNV